jgi:RNA polymerase sigma factor (sigma-70 family)
MVLHQGAIGGTLQEDASSSTDARWAWREAIMPETTEFTDFIRRIRAGEDEAARELVARFEPIIRREVRVRLRDPRLYSRFDSSDVCQSVMASFFVRAQAGQFDLERPDQLLRLLVVMTRHKLAKQERRHRAGRRDYRRLEPVDLAHLEERSPAAPSPSRLVAGRELLAEFRRRLSDEERQLADLRALGHDWAEIASRLGGTPGARSKQLARALERVEQQLEGNEGDES